MLKKKVADILARRTTATCIAIDERSFPCMATMEKSEMFEDASGRFWCPQHQNRGELFSWAAKYNFPAIQFMGKMRYAIGYPGDSDNKTSWELAVCMGCEDLIQAAAAMLKPLDEVS